jgi:hypothetical protein
VGNRDEQGIRKGDRGFLFQLLGALALVFVLALLVLGVLNESSLGSCAARGFLQVTETPSSD